MLKCGASEKIITPDCGMNIPGYFEKRKVSGVKQDLYAKALVFETEAGLAAVVVCDAITVMRQEVLRIRKAVSERIPICPDAITVSGTHTHTGGPVTTSFGEKRDDKYLAYLVSQATDAAVEAYEKRVDAKLGLAKGELDGVAFIRRFHMKDGTVVTNPAPDNPDILEPEGTPDNSLIVMRVDDVAGAPIAFLTNYGVHLDTVGGTEACPDYPGVLSARIKQVYGSGVVSLFLTGPCGNTNHLNIHDPTTYTDPDMFKRIGNAMFEKVEQIQAGIVTSDQMPVSVDTRRFLVNLRRPSREQVDEARAILDGRIRQEETKMYKPELFAAMKVRKDESGEYVTEIEIKAIHIGESLIVAWPGEIFVEYGKAVRDAFPGRIVIMSELANGSVYCYIPNKSAFQFGGYETMMTDMMNPEEETGNLLVSETLKMLGKK